MVFLSWLRFLAACVGVWGTAFAQEALIWGTVTAAGSGTGNPCFKGENPSPTDNVLSVSSGPELSFVFLGFGIDLPKARSAFSQKNRCQLKARLLIPQGFALVSIGQVLLGSVTKDLGTSGGLTATTRLFDARVPLSVAQLLFLETRAMRRTDPIQKVTQDTLPPSWVRWQCGMTQSQSLATTLQTELLAYGQHIPRLNAFVMNLDTNDIKIGFKPQLLPCPRGI